MADPLRTTSNSRTSRVRIIESRRTPGGAAFGFAPRDPAGGRASPHQRGIRLVACLLGTLLLLQPAAAQQTSKQAPPAAESPAVEDLWRAATTHYRHGRWQLAVLELQELVEKHPQAARAAQAQFLLGEALVQLGRYAQAEAAYRRCLQQSHLPQRWRLRCRFRLGELAYFQARPRQAQQLLQQFLGQAKDDPWLAQAHWLLAQLARQQGSWQQAQKHLQQLIDRFPQSPLQDQARVLLAQLLLDSGQVEKALRYLEAVAGKENGPTAWQARFLLGKHYFAQGDYPQARKQFEQLLAQPKLPPAWRQVAQLAQARCLLATAERKQAAALLDALSHGKSPLALEARYWMTHLLRKQGRLKEAQQKLIELAQALDHAAPSPGEESPGSRPGKEAGPDASQQNAPLQITPARCWFEAAVLAHKTGRADQARRCYALAIKTAAAGEPWPAQARWGLLRLAVAEGKRHEAQEAFEQLLAQHADQPELVQRGLWRLGRLLLEKRRFADALRLASQVEGKLASGTSWQPQALRALALCGQRQYEQALKLLEPLLSAGQEAQSALPAEAAAELWYTAGVCHVERHRWDEAHRAFVRARRAAPLGSVAAQALAAQALVEAQRGHPAQCRRLVEQWQAQFPQAREALPWLLRLGHQRYEARDWNDAARFYRLALACSQPWQQVAARSGLAWSLWEQGKLTAALEQFQQVAGQKDVDAQLAAEAAYMAGLICHRLRRPQQALRHWQQLVDQFPRSRHAPQGLLAAGEVLEQLGRPQQALKRYLQIVKQYPQAPQRPAALFNAAWVAWQQNQPRQALELMEQLCRRWPDHLLWPQAALQLAYWLHDQRQPQKAAAWASRLVRRPECPDRYRAQAASLLGRMAVGEKRWAEVHRWMEAAAQMAPEDKLRHQARFWVCESLYQRGLFPQAHRQIQELLPQLQHPPPAWIATLHLRLAQCSVQMKKWRQALQEAEEALRRFPQFPQKYELHYVRGRALLALARFDQAREAFTRVIRSPRARGSQRAAMAQWMIGESYFHQRNYQEALRHYLRVDVLYPNHPSWQAAGLLQAGKCYEKLGQPDKATELYLRIVQQAADSPYKDQAAQLLRALRNQTTAVR